MSPPSPEHETPIALARADPELLPGLLTDLFGLRVPPHSAGHPHSADVQITQPSTYHADAVLVYPDDAGTPVFAVILEVQRAWDPRKRRTWRLYLAHIEAELDVPAALIVYCPDPRIGARYERMLAEDGVSLPLRPFLLTPERLPLITDPAVAARDPARAVLTVLAHRDDPRIARAFPAMAAVLETVGGDQFVSYYDIVRAGLPGVARTEWEDYMTGTMPGRYFLSEDLNQRCVAAEAKGMATGMAHGVLTALQARGFEVPDEARRRIETASVEELEAWLHRAVTAPTSAEALDG